LTLALLFDHYACGEDRKMGFENVGKVWSLASFAEMLSSIDPPVWCDSVTMHHTAAPSLVQRPSGFQVQHIKNIENFYRVEYGWHTGPHLFVDDRQIWGMCDLRKKGIHAASFNKRSIGIEVLGNYDVEDPKSARGLACWQTAAGAAGLVLNWLGVNASSATVLFHRDDPLTSKSCPGKKVDSDWVISLIGKDPVVEIENTPKPPILSIKLKNDELRYTGTGWFALGSAYLIAKGESFSIIRDKLKRKGGSFYYDGVLLEDAFYDKETAKTWISVRDLENLSI
jgi:N-acetylmuramoyl-L-alanine amidase